MAQQQEYLTGKIEVGDTVDTLDSKRTITGQVQHINKRGVAKVKGTEYPGGPPREWHTHVENLGLIEKAATSKREVRYA